MSSDVEQTDILVLGASFAGVEVVYQLLRLSDGKPPRITVVDRQSEHGYLPLVQERLCGVLDVESSRLSTRAFVESTPGARYVEDSIEGFDPQTKTASLASGRRVRGRFVVVALGSAFDAPPAIEGAERIATYKRESEFEATRADLAELLSGWSAEEEESPAVVVVGGGISGCELAGELARLASARPSGWTVPSVRLVTSAAALAPTLGARVGRQAKRALEGQQVTVDLGTRLEAVQDKLAVLRTSGESRTVRADRVLWAGGVSPAPILAALQLPRTEAGWLSVGPTLQCFATARPKHPDIFGCGDAVRVQGGEGEWPTMQRAIECIWQAKIVAQNILRLVDEEPTYPDGVPPLRPHALRETFFYGLSLGARSLVVYGGFGLDLPGINHWFRRWLMRQYLARYAPLPSAV